MENKSAPWRYLGRLGFAFALDWGGLNRCYPFQIFANLSTAIKGRLGSGAAESISFL